MSEYPCTCGAEQINLLRDMLAELRSFKLDHKRTEAVIERTAAHPRGLRGPLSRL